MVNEITLIFQSNSLTAIVLPCMNLPYNNIRNINHLFTFRKGGWGSLCCLHYVKDWASLKSVRQGKAFVSWLMYRSEGGRILPLPSLPNSQKLDPHGRAGLRHHAVNSSFKAAHLLPLSRCCCDTAELPGRTPHSWAPYGVLGNQKCGPFRGAGADCGNGKPDGSGGRENVKPLGFSGKACMKSMGCCWWGGKEEEFVICVFVLW